MSDYHSLQEYLKHTPDATSENINYIINTKHNYLVVTNSFNYERVLISVADNFKCALIGYGYITVLFDFNKTKQGCLCIDLNCPESDVLGYTDYYEAKTFCDMSKNSLILCNELNHKVIFSPQLANYLLDQGYKMIHLKPKYGTVNETVYVFEDNKSHTIENTIEQFKEKHGGVNF